MEGEGDTGRSVARDAASAKHKRQASEGEEAAASSSGGDADDVSRQLSLRPLAWWTFEEEKQQHQVFVDEVKQLLLFYTQSTLTVRDFGSTTPHSTFSLGLREGERLIWAELSVDLKYLLVHTMSRPNWIKIYSLEGGRALERYLVQSKRTGTIERVHWAEANNLFIVSSSGIEFYQIPNRESLSLVEKWTMGDKDMRLIKEFKLPIYFSMYYASTRVLMTCTGTKGGKVKLEGYFFKQDFVTKLPKFEIDLTSKDASVTADNFALCRLYERLYCAYIEESQISLYQLSKTTISKKAIILLVGQPLPHRVRLQSIDNLLAVHNTDTKVTTLYDIRASPLDDELVRPFATSTPISPFINDDHPIIMYQERWRYLQTNYVLDMDERTLFEITLETAQLAQAFSSKEQLIQFLLRRTNTRSLTLDTVRNLIEQGERLMTLSKIFDAIASVADLSAPPDKNIRSVNTQITRTMTVVPPGGKSPLPPVTVIPSGTSSLPTTPIAVRNLDRKDLAYGSSPLTPIGESPSHILSSTLSSSPFSWSASASPTIPAASSEQSFYLSPQPQPFTPLAAWDAPKVEEEKRGRAGQLLLDQHDLYNNVFMSVDDMITQSLLPDHVDSKYFVSVMTEYVRSLNYYKQNVEHYIYKLIIQHLITSNRYYQLHQFLQYHVINDSVHVACQLLSVEKHYPPAYQLALDMLKRLSTSRKAVKDQIIEVLLTRNQVLPALRFSKSNSDASAPPQRFLEVALQQRDENLFYTVYRYFEKEGRINKECAPYIEEFCKMFSVSGDSTKQRTSDPTSPSLGPFTSSDSFSLPSSDDSAPSSAYSSLTTFADISTPSTSSPYASPSPSPFASKRAASKGV